MLKTKRKRAVVLALIAFFCTAATTYVAVDWKRFGGGFLAYFRGKGDEAVASKPAGGAGSTGDTHIASADDSTDKGGPLPRLVSGNSHKHTADASHGAGGGHKSDEDLFKYGDPAAGGIPPGRFIVADNQGGGSGGEHGGQGPQAGPQVTGPAPQPGPAPDFGAAGPSNSGLSDTGLNGHGSAPSPSTSQNPPPPPTSGTPTPPAPVPPSPPVSGPPSPPVSGPPAPPIDTPAPPPGDQAGTTDPGDPSGTPVSPSSPVSAVPEASTTSMMALGALFLAVAATRRRKKS